MNKQFKVEQRKVRSPLNMCRNWHLAPGTDECITTGQASQEALRLVGYDQYHSLQGWEYRVVEFTPKKKRED